MTPQERKVIELAFEALLESKPFLNDLDSRIKHSTAITATKEALAKPEPADNEQDAFEQKFGMPINCTRFTGGYAATNHNAWDAHAHCLRWEGWKARANNTPPQPKKPEQEPVAWVYPEGLEALKAGKPWTAYGTRQEPNNTALYLSPQPDITPYAWVTFTPYGDEDDVWYENPEGQLLEGWTYKPLYDTIPPQRKPLTRGQIREIEVDVSLNPSFDYITPAEQLCRAIEAAHNIKE